MSCSFSLRTLVHSQCFQPQEQSQVPNNPFWNSLFIMACPELSRGKTTTIKNTWFFSPLKFEKKTTLIQPRKSYRTMVCPALLKQYQILFSRIWGDAWFRGIVLNPGALLLWADSWNPAEAVSEQKSITTLKAVHWPKWKWFLECRCPYLRKLTIMNLIKNLSREAKRWMNLKKNYFLLVLVCWWFGGHS